MLCSIVFFSCDCTQISHSQTNIQEMEQSENYRSQALQWTNPEYNEFYLELPHEEIKQWVHSETETLISAIKDKLPNIEVNIEHVGSTAIDGMCGTRNPDGLMVLKEFPPNEHVMTALETSGYFRTDRPRKGPKIEESECIWFIKFINQGFLDGQYFKIHVTKENSKTHNDLINVRENLLTDQLCFESYQKAKIEASTWIKTNFVRYKRIKARSLPTS